MTDQPEGVQLRVSEETVCNGANVTFNCSAADAIPMELTYHLFENNFLIGSERNTGVWNKTITSGGVLVYRCKVSNVVGTLYSPSVSVTVNGKRLVSASKNVQQCFGVHCFLTVHCDSQTKTYIRLFINFLLFAKQIQKSVTIVGNPELRFISNFGI